MKMAKGRENKVKESKETAEKVDQAPALRDAIVKEAIAITSGESVDVQLLMAFCRQLEKRLKK